MQRSLVGSEMCIRDSFRGQSLSTLFLHERRSHAQSTSDPHFISSVGGIEKIRGTPVSPPLPYAHHFFMPDAPGQAPPFPSPRRSEKTRRTKENSSLPKLRQFPRAPITVQRYLFPRHLKLAMEDLEASIQQPPPPPAQKSLQERLNETADQDERLINAHNTTAAAASSVAADNTLGIPPSMRMYKYQWSDFTVSPSQAARDPPLLHPSLMEQLYASALQAHQTQIGWVGPDDGSPRPRRPQRLRPLVALLLLTGSNRLTIINK